VSRATTTRFVALGHDFALSADEARVAYVQQLYAQLATAGTAETNYVIDDSGLRFGDELLTDDDSLVIDMLVWHVNREVVGRSGQHLLLHAGAVQSPAGAVVVAGPSGTGKTTLVAALVDAGLDYLTDEIAALDLNSGLVLPYAKPLTVKGEGQRPIERVGEPCPLAAAVFAAYEPDATPRLEPVHRADALIELAQNSFNFPDHGAAALEALAGAIRSAQCHRLVMGDPHAAAALVIEALS
jgi:hypothetical protein